MEHVLVQVFRSGELESLHEGFAAVVDRDGKLQAGFGNSEYETFLRSSAKPFQCYPLLLKGGLEKFGFTREELTVMCASHTGQPPHVAAVRSILKKTGMNESDLQCGAHPPMYTPEAERILRENGEYTEIHNNCSGKHAGMLAQTILFNADPATYLSLSNPVQINIVNTIALFSDLPPEGLHCGVDGCSAPIFKMPLNKMALMFARLAQGGDHHMKTIRDAIAKNPFYLAGDGRFDTALIEATDGRLITKTGAEGVQCAGIVDGGPRPELSGWGIAVKVMDGCERARGPVLIEIFDQLGVLTDKDKDILKTLHYPDLKNHAGLVVGKIFPSFRLEI